MLNLFGSNCSYICQIFPISSRKNCQNMLTCCTTAFKTYKCLGFREQRFLKQKAKRYPARCLYCTHESLSDLGHAQSTRGPDSGPRRRILPDLVSSSPFPSPLPHFFVLELPKRDLETYSTQVSFLVPAVVHQLPDLLSH